MSGANREYVDRTCLHDEVCIYREEHMRKGVERMNKSRVTEYILAYMQEKGISTLVSVNLIEDELEQSEKKEEAIL